MSAPATTYESLLRDVQQYSERHDSSFEEQLPRFVMLAEQRIAMDPMVRGLGFLRAVSTTLKSGAPTLAKPSRWRETGLFELVGRRTLFERDRGFLNRFWPDRTKLAEPRYYADYTMEQWLIAGTPDADYEAEILYFDRPEPLSSENQESWTTRNAPQLLLYSSMIEAAGFCRNPEMAKYWEGQYGIVRELVKQEGERRLRSRAVVRDGS